MKANHSIRMASDPRAQVGIGTMIVFIATILVAAAAAALLLDTSGQLQERSAQTGAEATREIASNLVIKSAYGMRATSSADIGSVHVTASLAPGSPPIDLSQLIATYSDGGSLVRLDHGAVHGGDVFVPQIVRDPQGTFSAETPVIGSGALVEFQFDLNEIGDVTLLGVRTEVEIRFMAEAGTPVSLTFTTPPSYGVNLVVLLR